MFKNEIKIINQLEKYIKKNDLSQSVKPMS